MDTAVVQAISDGFAGLEGVLLFWAIGSLFVSGLNLWLDRKE